MILLLAIAAKIGTHLPRCPPELLRLRRRLTSQCHPNFNYHIRYQFLRNILEPIFQLFSTYSQCSQENRIMAYLTALTQGGIAWTPRFIQKIEITRCLGCGRCLKVCGRGVLHLQAVNDEFEFVDEEEEESERKVMTIAHPELCIGCQACTRICPKNCYSHAPQSLN